mgnify:CR=1 FL=1
MSSNLLAAISTIGGDYNLNADDLGEFDSLQKELEYTTATMYLLSQRKLDYGLSVAIPAMTSQLQSDASFAGLYGAVNPEYERAVVGVSNAAAASTSNAVATLLAASSPMQRSGYLWLAEKLTYSAAAMVASLTALSRATAYEAYRMARDNSMSYLFSDIEHATKVRGIGDEMGSVGMASMFTAAKEHLDAMSHSSIMAQAEWDKQQIKKKFDTKAFDIGNLVGQAVSGLSDGYAASKANATLAAQ